MSHCVVRQKFTHILELNTAGNFRVGDANQIDDKKRAENSTAPHSFISQKEILFIVIALKISDPTSRFIFLYIAAYMRK
jgi:hypothetical protein